MIRSSAFGLVVVGNFAWAVACVALQPSAPYYTRIAVFRPETAEWFLRNEDGSTTSVQFGQSGEVHGAQLRGPVSAML